MDLPRYHRLRMAYYRLEGQRCEACGRLQFPPRSDCKTCRSRQMRPFALGGRGTLYSFTEVGNAPEGFAAPYLLAMVELEEGIRVSAQLTDIDPDRVQIGMPVEMVTRKIREHGPTGLLVYGYKFRPVLSPGANL